MNGFIAFFKRFKSLFHRKTTSVKYLPKPKKGNGKIVSFRRRVKK